MASADGSNRDVAYYFNLAIEESVDINIFFLLDKCPISQVKAPCVGIKNGHFIVRATLEELEEQPIIWGSEVRGYFTVRDLDIEYCHFRTKLARIYNGPVGSMYLIFPLPRSLDHNQPRFSRRVALEHGETTEFGLWVGSMEGGDEETLPRFKWRPLENYECDLGEISASGLRLDVREDTALAERLSINDLVLLKGDFGTPAKPYPIFVVGSIVRRMPKPDSENIVCFGCHFLGWREVDPKRGKAWFRADPQEGVGRIAQWISRNYRSLAQ